MYSKEDLKDKMDAHIEQILVKPAISNEEFALLDVQRDKLPDKTPFGMDFEFLLWMMLFLGFGGGKGEL